uniref:Uncharacterized protein n=1 Tax=Lactuca sativa TaxID=4236 RepID=A0A9R1UVG9_LACSA|nr:hypothetical protein LSAT_V11C800424110 [Lactuca sativa]
MVVKAKTKENVAARRDLELYCRKRKGVKYDQRAYYALDKNEKKAICELVCVDLTGCRLFGMKSHDCHVFMQRLMPIAFLELLPK